MKRIKFIYVALASLIWLASGLPSFAQNKLSMDDKRTVYINDTVHVPVKLDNADEVVALQMTVNLPEDVYFEIGNFITLNDERIDGHELMINHVSEGEYVVLIFTDSNKPIKEKSGVLLTLNLGTRYSFDPTIDHTVKLSNIVMADKTGRNVSDITDLSCQLSYQADGPDLFLCNLKLDKNRILPGDTVTISYDVKNIGSEDTNGGVYEDIIMSGSNYITLKEGLDESYNVKVGETITRSVVWTAPAENEYCGKYKISGRAYASNENEKYWPQSNQEIELLVGNALYVTRSDYGDLSESDTNEHFFILEREGDTSQAADITIKLNVDRLYIDSIAHFDAGETSIQIPFKVKSNDIVDVNPTVYVSFEAEGYSTDYSIITITDDGKHDYVDLKVENVTYDTTKEYSPGDEFTVTSYIKNNGSKALTAGWKETIWVEWNEGYTNNGCEIQSTEKHVDLTVGSQTPITTSFKFPDMPGYGGDLRIILEVSPLDDSEPSQFTGDNTFHCSENFKLKKIIKILPPEKTDFEEKPCQQSATLKIQRSAYLGEQPMFSGTSTNGRITVDGYYLQKQLESEITVFIDDNKKVEESDEEVLTISVDGYEPVSITFNIKNDDLVMTEEHKLLKKFVESELLDKEKWTGAWDFSDGVMNANLDGVTLDAENHVTEIDLSGRKLSGTLPRHLFDLPNLQKLNLSVNGFCGSIQDVLGDINAASESLRQVNISKNDFTGNLGKFAEKLPSSVTELNAYANLLEEIDPALPTNIEDCDISDQRLNLSFENKRITEINKDFFESLPQIIRYHKYSHMTESSSIYSVVYSKPMGEYVAGEDFVMYFDYNMTNDKHSLNWYQGNERRYFGNSGDFLYWKIHDVAWAKIGLVFDKGDCNFDDAVNASDLQATVLESFDHYHIPYNFTAGNTYEDDVINVQDVICTVNMLLDSMSGSISAAAKSRQSEQLREEDVEARVYISDGKVMLKSDKKVAAFTIKARGSISWATDVWGMSQTTSENGIVGYSLMGNCLPEGITVLGTCGDNAHIIDVSLADEQAMKVKSVIGDGETTGIGSTFINSFDGQNVYDLNGIRQKSVGKGLYIIEKDGKTNKVSINKRK